MDIQKEDLVCGIRDLGQVNVLLGLYYFLHDNFDSWKDRAVVLERCLEPIS